MAGGTGPRGSRAGVGLCARRRQIGNENIGRRCRSQSGAFFCWMKVVLAFGVRRSSRNCSGAATVSRMLPGHVVRPVSRMELSRKRRRTEQMKRGAVLRARSAVVGIAGRMLLRRTATCRCARLWGVKPTPVTRGLKPSRMREISVSATGRQGIVGDAHDPGRGLEDICNRMISQRPTHAAQSAVGRRGQRDQPCVQVRGGVSDVRRDLLGRQLFEQNVRSSAARSATTPPPAAPPTAAPPPTLAMPASIAPARPEQPQSPRPGLQRRRRPPR